METNDKTTYDDAAAQNNNNVANTVNNTAATSAKRKKISWKKVGVGAGSGILLGSVGAALTSATSGDSTTNFTADEIEQIAGNGVDVAHDVNDDMSFADAFAAARAEVGPGGVFEWHGNLYSTYTADEWDGLGARGQQAVTRNLEPDAETEAGENEADEATEDARETTEDARETAAEDDVVATDDDDNEEATADDKGEDDYKPETPNPGDDIAPEDNMHVGEDKIDDTIDIDDITPEDLIDDVDVEIVPENIDENIDTEEDVIDEPEVEIDEPSDVVEIDDVIDDDSSIGIDDSISAEDLMVDIPEDGTDYAADLDAGLDSTY